MGITPIGVTNFRNTNQRFGIRDNDRLSHMYCIGRSGTGKSTLLKRMALSDIRRGNGLAVIDPHGDVAQELLQKIPPERQKDLIYFNPRETRTPIAYNPLHNVPVSYHHLVASGLISTFKNIWSQSWGVRLEHILRNCILTLLWYPDATLLDIQPLLTDQEFRSKVLVFVLDDSLQLFWTNEFEQYSKAYRIEAIGAILNKTGTFISSLPVRRIIGQKTSSFRLSAVMDESKILIADLSKGIIGDDAASLLGGILLGGIHMAAMHRARLPISKRKNYYIYIDECHSFLSLAFCQILSEARKYSVSLYLTHQYINQLQPAIRDAIFGNCGTVICFRIGAEDAQFLSREMYPPFTEVDLVNLPRYSMYIKLMIDGTTSNPFSAVTTTN